MINKLKAECLFSKGTKQAEQGCLEESIATFDKALSFNPSYSHIYLHKALSLSRMGKGEQALREVARAIAIKPTNAAYHLFRGIICYDFHKYNEALNAFDKTLELSPDNFLALCYKNLTILATGNRSKDACLLIKHNIIKFMNVDFQSKLLAHCENFCYQNRNNIKSVDILNEQNTETFESSARHIELLILRLNSIFYKLLYSSNLKKKSAYIQYIDAIKNELSGNYDAAIKGYQKALQIYPEYVDASDKMLKLYWINKDYCSFIEMTKKVDAYNKTTDLILKYRANGDVGKVESDLIKYVPLIFNLAYAHYQIGHHDEALDLFNLLSTFDQRNSYVFYYLGLCYIAKNDPRKALSSFQRSPEHFESNLLENRLGEMITLLDKV